MLNSIVQETKRGKFRMTQRSPASQLHFALFLPISFACVHVYDVVVFDAQSMDVDRAEALPS